MNNKLRMLVINEIATTTLGLSLGAEIATLPLDNLKVYNNSRTFRTTDISEIQITGNFDDLKLITGFVLWRHNLSNTATMQLEFFDADNQSGLKVYDSNEISAIEQLNVSEWDWRTQPVVSSVFDSWDTRYSQIWLDDTFAKSFKLTIKDPLNTDKFIDITRIYMGQHFEPNYNFSYGHELGLDSNEQQFRTDDGSLFGYDTPKWRTQKFSLNYTSDLNRPLLSNAIRYAGLSKDWFVSMFPGAGGQKEIEYAFACKFTDLAGIKAAAENIFQSNISIEEC